MSDAGDGDESATPESQIIPLSKSRKEDHIRLRKSSRSPCTARTIVSTAFILVVVFVVLYSLVTGFYAVGQDFRTFDALWMAWLVLSNLSYVIPANIAWHMELYDVFAALLGVTVVSTLHHGCYDANLCLGLDRTSLSQTDVFTAFYAIASGVFVLVNYDLVEIESVKSYRILHDGEYLKTQKKLETKRRLRKHTYADVVNVLFLPWLFILVVAIDDAFISGVGVVVFFIIVLVVSSIFYWDMKRRTWRYRFNVWIIVGFIVGIGSTFLFVFEHSVGRPYHGIWHIGGALTIAFTLVGSSNYLFVEESSKKSKPPSCLVWRPALALLFYNFAVHKKSD